MRNLLSRTLKPIAWYALFVIGLSIPVYYLVIDFIWINELDKHHFALKKKIETRINKLGLKDSDLEQTILIWNKIEPGIIINKATPNRVQKDSAYTVIRYDDFMQDREQFRCLVSYVRINGVIYRLLIQTNMEEQDETILYIAATAVLFFMILLGGGIILMRRIAIKLWQPFYDTLNQLKLFNLNNLTKPGFEAAGIREFEELNNSLNNLISENIDAYKQQKEFTENASHELQTPLAIVQSQLDLLLQTDALTGEQSAGIERAGKALAKVTRINKNLLLLAKIGNHQFGSNEQVNLSAVLTELTETLKEPMANKQLDVEENIQPAVSVTANYALVEIMLNNLLVNAINHNITGGNITLSLTQGSLIIANTGAVSLDADKLFKRFSTQAAGARGSGLGLDIVKQITNLYNWPIAYTHEDRYHIFTVRF